MYTIRHFLTPQGHDPFLIWLRKLRDPVGKGQIIRRVGRIENGNFGDHKFSRDGVWELRIDHGPGYRVYYAMAGDLVVVFLCGGDKSHQHTDIERAVQYWNEWQRSSQ